MTSPLPLEVEPDTPTDSYLKILLKLNPDIVLLHRMAELAAERGASEATCAAICKAWAAMPEKYLPWWKRWLA